MKITTAAYFLASFVVSCNGFQTVSKATTTLLLGKNTALYSSATTTFDETVKSNFPGAIDNSELQSKVVSILNEKGYSPDNTLLATSLCCDELARRLEDVFVDIYGKNFNLGGLSGFPFAGNTGFGAMAAHIPDDGFCLIVYGPHVGISQDGTVGKVERDGIKLLDTCCGSAVAASNYLKGITKGGATITTNIKSFTDFQQSAVQKMILPYGQRLEDAENPMTELPYALYETQDLLMAEIVEAGFSGTKKGVALLGGVQINTGPTSPDYFHALRFDYLTHEGQEQGTKEDLLPKLFAATVDEQEVDTDVEGAPESIDSAFFANVVSEPEDETAKNQKKIEKEAEEKAKEEAEEAARIKAEEEAEAAALKAEEERKAIEAEAAAVKAEEERKAKEEAEEAARIKAEEEAEAAALKAKEEHKAIEEVKEEVKTKEETTASSSTEKATKKSKDMEPIVGGIFPKSSGGDLRSSVPGKRKICSV